MTIHFTLDKINDAAVALIAAMGTARVVAFYGAMGAGKTTLIQAICKQLGVKDIVTSPTFAIINEYTTDRQEEHIFHFDFYRINNLEEVYDMGYEEYFYSGYLCLIEWPELIEPLLPSNALRLSITEDNDGARIVTMKE